MILCDCQKYMDAIGWDIINSCPFSIYNIISIYFSHILSTFSDYHLPQLCTYYLVRHKFDFSDLKTSLFSIQFHIDKNSYYTRVMNI